MKRVFIQKMPQIILIPTLGFVKSKFGVSISFAWINIGIVIMLKRCKEREDE